jgi:hypothetical protein
MIASLGKILERFEDSISTRIDRHRGKVAPGNRPALVNDEERALGDSLAVAVNSVKLRHRTFRFKVSEQREMKIVVM